MHEAEPLATEIVQDFERIEAQQHLLPLFERTAAAIALMITSPLLIIAAVVIWILSRQSPLVAHERVGLGGRTLWVLKLRTMWPSGSKSRAVLIERVSPPPVGAPQPKVAGDPRVSSRFARFCRRYSVDELPQLWQVLRGDMSLVAPRPLTRYEMEHFYGPDGDRLLRLKPGITGLWQVNGRSRLTYQERRQMDLFFMNQWSLWLYLRILVTTVPKVLTGKDAW